MTSTQLNASLIIAASAGLALGVRLAAWPLVRVSVPEGVVTPATLPAAMPVPPGDSLATVIVARDPLRVTRRPAPVIYDPVRLAQPATPPAAKPQLALAGIVWEGGANATALVEGITGIEGPRVVRKGEVVGDLRVKDIRRDRVVIVGRDTVWTLTVREPWK